MSCFLWYEFLWYCFIFIGVFFEVRLMNVIILLKYIVILLKYFGVIGLLSFSCFVIVLCICVVNKCIVIRYYEVYKNIKYREKLNNNG